MNPTRTLAALTLTAALLAAAAPAAPLREASVTRIINDVRIMDTAGAQRAATLTETVRERQAVVTGLQSRAELLFPDQTLTRLGANTVFTFKEGTRAMDLQRGTMLLQVPKGAGGAQIKTAAVTAAITGTTLMVEYSPGSGQASPSVFPALATTPTPPPVPVSQGERAVASEITGTVRILVPGATAFRPLNPGESIPPGSSLMTGSTGSATVSPVPGTALRVLPNTTLRVDESQAAGTTPRVRLDLREGGVINMISRQNFQHVDYQVTTPQGVCAARGTVFGIFVSGGQVLVLGAHGAAAFNGQSVGPGKAFGFGPGGRAPLTPDSAQFQNLLNQTLLALSQAAARGMIPPDFLTQVGQQLQKSGLPLTPAQQQLLTPPPAGPVTAGNPANNGKGFAKVVVIEGQVRVFITGKPGESMLLGPGQMIIFSPDATRLPNPVDFDLETLLKTSKLLKDMDENAQIADNAGNLDQTEILLALEKQKDEILRQILGGTNLFIFDGNEVVQLDQDNIFLLQQLIDALGGSLPGLDPNPGNPGFPPGSTGPLTTITGFPGLGAGTTVATNPTITDTGGNVLATGKIMTGDPDIDGTASAAAYLFGRPANAFDSAINFDGNITPTLAAFRFDSLTLHSGFPINTSGPNAQKKLALIDETGLTINLASPLNLAPLGPSGGLLLASANGDVTHSTGAINLSASDLIYYASNGNLHISNTATLNGPGTFTGAAAGTINYNGTAAGLNEFTLTAGTTINYNGTVSAHHVDFSNTLNLSPGALNLSGGAITATTLDVSANNLLFGPTSLAPLGASIAAYFSATHLTLGQDKSFDTHTNVYFNIQDGTFNGNSFSLFGVRGLTALAAQVSGFDDLGIIGGDINITDGDLLINGDLTALAAFNPGTGRITVTNGDIGSSSAPVQSITADGNIAATNIYVSDLLRTNGATSTITAAETIDFSSAPGTLITNGAVNAGSIVGELYSIQSPVINLTGFEIGLNALSIQTNSLNAPGAFVHTSNISAFGATPPTNALLRAYSLFFDGGGIHYANPNPGGPGTNLTIELSNPFTFGSETGPSTVDVTGGYGIGVNGGNGGHLRITAPSHFITHATGDIRASGGFASGSGTRGGHGGSVRLEATEGDIQLVGYTEDGFDYLARMEAVGGFADEGTGAHSGNGGAVHLLAPEGDVTLHLAQVLTETRHSDTPAAEKIGGTIDIRASGPDLEGGSETPPNIGISNSILYATGDPSNNSVSTRGGRITLHSLRNYLNPTAAIVINNSSDLLAMTNAAVPAQMAVTEIQTGDGTFTKGQNAFIEIGDPAGTATLIRADILRLQALNPNGGIKLFAGSHLSARDQVLLYAGSLTTGGSIDFLGAGTVHLNSPQVLARAGAINVGANTTVQISGATNVGLYADTRGWTGAPGPGGIQVNGPNPVPNVITVNQPIGGANVNVNTRNAPGAPSTLPAPPPPPPPGG